MSKEASIKLNASQISQYSCDDLCQILENAKGNIVLEIPGMGDFQSFLDKAEVYYRALFIGENIASFCEKIYFEDNYNYTHPIYFVFQPDNIAGLAQQLLWLFPLCDLDLDDDYPVDDLYNEYVVEKYLELIPKLSESLRTLIGQTTDIACSWDKLDDDKFEELCYDVVNYRHQPAKILKMGKSRSRDGGRDIVFHTTGRAGKPPVKWIVQCKLIRDGSSLAGSKVQVADPVDQYGAGGFCVMTSGVIDSTLYDKLEGVARNRGIEIDWWSRLELERFLARHTELRDRYFGKEMENKKSSQSQNVQLSLLDILEDSSSGSA